MLGHSLDTGWVLATDTCAHNSPSHCLRPQLCHPAGHSSLAHPARRASSSSDITVAPHAAIQHRAQGLSWKCTVYHHLIVENRPLISVLWSGPFSPSVKSACWKSTKMSYLLHHWSSYWTSTKEKNKVLSQGDGDMREKREVRCRTKG